MLTQQQVDFWNEHGWIHIPNVFSAEEIEAMRDDLNWLIEVWAERSQGWVGPWRNVYMDDETNAKSELVAMHDLHFYTRSWMQAVTNPTLCESMADLLDGGPVELHHSTMHVKPCESGQPFPMHQDWAFYQHDDGRYIDVLVHLDDTSHENGEIRFLDGSHKQGPLEHVVTFPDGSPCTPHLPTDEYNIADTVPVPARKGDVVCFNINTIHGSHINQTDDMRRMVRIGYKHPDNVQSAGQSKGRPGLLVWGRRERNNQAPLFPTSVLTT